MWYIHDNIISHLITFFNIYCVDTYFYLKQHNSMLKKNLVRGWIYLQGFVTHTRSNFLRIRILIFSSSLFQGRKERKKMYKEDFIIFA